jgi:hypothetical protein
MKFQEIFDDLPRPTLIPLKIDQKRCIDSY